MNGIKILGMGRSVPAQVVTNDDMARIVDTSDEWITSRTGIRSRHHCRGETHTQLCREAAQRALERAGVRPEEIGACIVAKMCIRDRPWAVSRPRDKMPMESASAWASSR